MVIPILAMTSHSPNVFLVTGTDHGELVKQHLIDHYSADIVTSDLGSPYYIYVIFRDDARRADAEIDAQSWKLHWESEMEGFFKANLPKIEKVVLDYLHRFLLDWNVKLEKGIVRMRNILFDNEGI
jgi:hypothetical protein